MAFDGLKNLQKKAGEFKEQQSIPLPDLLTPSFIKSCSAFNDVQELFDKSGFKIDSAEDFTAIPDNAWDKYISENTTYSSWSDMLGAAGTAWTKKQLGL